MRPIQEADVKCDPVVKEFYSALNSGQEDQEVETVKLEEQAGKKESGRRG